MNKLDGCRAVFFDLFQTLIPIAPGPSLLNVFCTVTGLDESACDVDKRALYLLASTGKHPGAEGAVRETCDKMGIRLDEGKLPGLIKYRIDRHLYGFSHIDPKVPQVLRSLKSKGLRIALVSNSDSEIVSAFSDSPFADLFKETFFSHEVGIAKPDPAIFQLACECMGLAPKDCLFVADGANREFEGAKATGLKTALVMRYADPARREEWGSVCDVVIEDLRELIGLL